MEQLFVVVAGNLGQMLASAGNATAGASVVSGQADLPGAHEVQADGVLPVPLGWALGILGGAVLIAVLAFSRPVRGRIHQCYVAVNRWIDAV